MLFGKRTVALHAPGWSPSKPSVVQVHARGEGEDGKVLAKAARHFSQLLDGKLWHEVYTVVVT